MTSQANNLLSHVIGSWLPLNMKNLSALRAIVRGVHRSSIDSPHKGPVIMSFDVLFCVSLNSLHDAVIKWKHFPCYWPFVQGIHRSSVNSPHKGQWRGALMFSLISAWINGWVNNLEAGDLRRHRTHYDVTVMDWKRRVTQVMMTKSNEATWRH